MLYCGEGIDGNVNALCGVQRLAENKGGNNMDFMKWLYRVEVGNWKEAEKVIEVAKEYGAMWKRGKAYGKPGNIKCVVYVEADAFGFHGSGRDKMRDIMARRVPGSKVGHGELLEVVSV
jgi:hypothetical protein